MNGFIQIVPGNRNRSLKKNLLILQQKSSFSEKTTKDDSNTTNEVKVTNSSSSSSSNSYYGSEQETAEKRIVELQANVREHHRVGAYHNAFLSAEDLVIACEGYFGPEHPATASALNDMALMCKLLGTYSKAQDHYRRALSIYEVTVGSDHASYAATLHNMGALDRAMADNYPTDDDNDKEDNQEEDETVTFTEEQRIELTSSAVSKFERALQIRIDELGENHPRTVTSRSNLGAALATLLLRRHTFFMSKQQTSSSSSSSQESTHVDHYGTATWEAAEEHLRAALQTAIRNPRGQQASVPEDTDALSGKKKRDRSLSKKERIKLASEQRRQQQQQRQKLKKKRPKENPTLQGIGSGDPTILTLSAAGAAQNLAVLLKHRADIESSSSSSSSSSSFSTMTFDSNNAYMESKSLYESALRVRSMLLGSNHPDTVASKFSLAELFDGPMILRDLALANRLRNDILDSYNVKEEG